MNTHATSFSKLICLNVLLMWIVCGHLNAQTRVGASSSDPINPAASLEIQSGPYPDNTYRGLLLPRVALTGYDSWLLAGSPTDGMLIFNTATTTGEYGVTPGIYCWYNFQWVRQSPAGSATIISSINCLPNLPATGSYYTQVGLTSNNTKQIIVTPGSAGPYLATTSTSAFDGIKGYIFSAAGTFTAAQVGIPQTIVLKVQPNGVPKNGGVNTFTLTIGTKSCTFTVNAINTFDCSGPLSGIYKVGQSLDASNTKQVTFVPLAAGSYVFESINYIGTNPIKLELGFTSGPVVYTDAQVGISQTVILQGSGTPSYARSTSRTISGYKDGNLLPFVTCDFTFTVAP